jgi:hypothetical protein
LEPNLNETLDNQPGVKKALQAIVKRKEGKKPENNRPPLTSRIERLVQAA